MNLFWILAAAVASPALAQELPPGAPDPYLLVSQDVEGLTHVSLAPEYLEFLRSRVDPYHRDLPLGSIEEVAYQAVLSEAAEGYRAFHDGRYPDLETLRVLAGDARSAVYGPEGGLRESILEAAERKASVQAQREFENGASFVVGTAACIPGVEFCVAGGVVAILINERNRTDIANLLDGNARFEDFSPGDKVRIGWAIAGVPTPLVNKALTPIILRVLPPIVLRFLPFANEYQ